ncbi:hypothetical protein GOODEAATRI_011463 [Goodea atripinnis]|uniref:Uncharacterized protein n=1 Tax=Goodea atripinnis TaxID=208336 RepID=A0ABV0NJF6_9TELE
METRQRALKPRICDQSVCQKGCGLLLSGHSMDTTKKQCCVEPLRAVKRALEERGAGLEHASRMARLRWNRTEQSLVAQVATLQNEAQLAALTYQQRLQRYLLHISSIVEQITGYCKDFIKPPTVVAKSNISSYFSKPQCFHYYPLAGIGVVFGLLSRVDRFNCGNGHLKCSTNYL